MRFIWAGAVFDPCRDYLLLFHSGIGPSTKYRRGQDEGNLLDKKLIVFKHSYFPTLIIGLSDLVNSAICKWFFDIR